MILLKKLTYSLLAFLILGVYSLNSQINNPIADQAYKGFNKAFLIENNGLRYYKASIENFEKDYFWQQALDIQSTQDYFVRTKDPDARDLIEDLLDAFLILNRSNNTNDPKSWEWNNYNDDLFWATLAFCRGYEITGNQKFLEQAEYGFNLAYYHNNTGNWGWDNQLGGGIWWSRSMEYKETLSNGPAIVVACYLYEVLGEQQYLDKALEIYAWLRNNLFNENTGEVYNKIKADGEVNYTVDVFNCGSFGAAANALYQITGNYSYFKDAKRAFDYVKNIKFKNGILYATNRNGSENAEYIRWLAQFVRDNNLWEEYYPWLQLNAEVAWDKRREDFNITWNDWRIDSPSDNSTVIESNSGVVIQQITPILQSISQTIQAKDYNYAEGVLTTSIDEEELITFTNDLAYVEYFIDIPESGRYTISYNIASSQSGNFTLYQKGRDISTVNFPDTGGNNTRSKIEDTVNLIKGTHTIRIQANTNTWRLKDIKITKDSDCETPAVKAFQKINDNEMEEQASSIVAIGDHILLSPSPETGTWRWEGPDEFEAVGRELEIDNIQRIQEGVYTAIYTNDCGAINTVNYKIMVNPPCDAAPIIPYINVNNEGWEQTSSVAVESGSKINIGPQPLEGAWTWIGPNGFSSYSREFTINDISENQFGIYVATYTDDCGAQVTMDFEIKNSDALKISDAFKENSLFKIYPNPNNGLFNLHLPNSALYKLKISTVSGSLVHSEVLNVNNEFSFDLSGILKPGIYMVTLSSNDVASTKKMIVK